MKRASGAVVFGPVRHTVGAVMRPIASIAAEASASSLSATQSGSGRDSRTTFFMHSAPLSRSLRGSTVSSVISPATVHSIPFFIARRSSFSVAATSQASASPSMPMPFSHLPPLHESPQPSLSSQSRQPPNTRADVSPDPVSLVQSPCLAQDHMESHPIDEVESLLMEVIESKIAPAVRDDGGDIHLRSWDPTSGTVTVALTGACASCDRSTITMRFLVEKALKFYVPEVKTVARAPVDESAAGAGKEAVGGWGCAPPVDPVQPQQHAVQQMR